MRNDGALLDDILRAHLAAVSHYLALERRMGVPPSGALLSSRHHFGARNFIGIESSCEAGRRRVSRKRGGDQHAGNRQI